MGVASAELRTAALMPTNALVPPPFKKLVPPTLLVPVADGVKFMSQVLPDSVVQVPPAPLLKEMTVNLGLMARGLAGVPPPEESSPGVTVSNCRVVLALPEPLAEPDGPEKFTVQVVALTLPLMFRVAVSDMALRWNVPSATKAEEANAIFWSG